MRLIEERLHDFPRKYQVSRGGEGDKKSLTRAYIETETLVELAIYAIREKNKRRPLFFAIRASSSPTQRGERRRIRGSYNRNEAAGITG